MADLQRTKLDSSATVAQLVETAPAICVIFLSPARWCRFHHRGIHAHPSSRGHAFGLSYFHHPPMNLTRAPAPQRPIILASGMLPPKVPVHQRAPRVPTPHNPVRMCLRVNKRSTPLAGVPAAAAPAFRVACRQHFVGVFHVVFAKIAHFVRTPSPKLSCRRRISIMLLARRL